MSAKLPIKNTVICTILSAYITKALYVGSITGAYHVDNGILQNGKFYQYYQIAVGDASDEADELFRELNGSEDEEESTSDADRSHSLFGLIFSIQKETGWSHDYILWGESWFNLQMKLNDLPGKKKKKEVKMSDSFDE